MASADIGVTLGFWLSEHPEALLGAVDASGAPVAMPADVPLGSEHQVDDRSLLELVVPEDTVAVTEAFIDALRQGIGTAQIHLASAPDQVNLLRYLDLRDRFGIMLRIVTPGNDSGSLQPRPLDIEEIQPARPRLCSMTKDEVATILSIDEATTLMLGWRPEEMVGQSNLQFIHPEDHVRAIDNWMSRHTNPSGHVGVVRLRYKCRDGSWLWLETSNTFHDAGGGTKVAVAQMIDVSDEMAAVEALRRSEGFLRRMSDTLPVGIFHVATDAKVVFVNPLLEKLLGGEPAANFQELARALVPDQWVALDEAIEVVLSEGADVDLDLALGNQTSCRITLRAVADEGTVLGVLGCIVDVTELKRMADTDSLTELPNRRAILQTLDAALATHDGRVGAIFVDLDGFKPVNDRYGHHVGDQLLASVADRLRAGVRPGDFVGRLGGDEFLVVCPGLGGAEDALKVACRLQLAMNGIFDLGDVILALTASFGVACGRPGVSADRLVGTADTAMYLAKQDPGGEPVYLFCD